MDFIVSSDLVQKFRLLIPVMVCVVIAILIRRTDGDIIAGFRILPGEKKRELREKGYVKKKITMILVMIVPLLASFVLSFVISDFFILSGVMMVAWLIFTLVLVIGLGRM